MSEQKNRFLNVWDDSVSGRDLLLSLYISTPLTLGGYSACSSAASASSYSWVERRYSGLLHQCAAVSP